MDNPVTYSSWDKIDSTKSGTQPLTSDKPDCRDLQEAIYKVRNELAREKSRRRRKKLVDTINGLRLELASTLIDLGQYEKSLFVLASVPWRSHEVDKCSAMATALTETGRFDEATKLLAAGLRRFPRSHRLWLCLGCLHEGLGDHPESLRCFEMAHQFGPGGSWEARYNKALVLNKLGSYGEAALILEDLAKEHPENSRLFVERGHCAVNMGYPHDGLRDYKIAMRLWEQAPGAEEGVRIYSGLCTAYAELGMKKEAAEIALEGLKRFPDEDGIMYHNVGATFFEMGWRQEAREVLRKGFDKFPDDEELKSLLRTVEDDMDDPDGGVKPPLLGLILLAALIRKRFRERRRP